MDERLHQLRLLLRDRLAMSWVFFSSVDLDGNGVLSRDEFFTAVAGMKGGFSREVTDRLFDEFDVDKSGDISYDEYVGWMCRDLLRQNARDAMKLFREMDTDGTGEVEKWEFRRALARMGFVAPRASMIRNCYGKRRCATAQNWRWHLWKATFARRTLASYARDVVG